MLVVNAIAVHSAISESMDGLSTNLGEADEADEAEGHKFPVSWRPVQLTSLTYRAVSASELHS